MKTTLLLHSTDNNGHDHNKTTYQEIKAFIMNFLPSTILEAKTSFAIHTHRNICLYTNGTGGRRKEEGTQGRRKGKGKSGSVVKPHIAPVA